MFKLLRRVVPNTLFLRFSTTQPNIRHTPKMSALKSHIVEAEKFISLEQYHLADIQIQKAASMQATNEQKAHLMRVRGELEMIKPNKSLLKAVEYFDQAIETSGNYSLDSFRHKIICMDDANTLQLRLKILEGLIETGKAKPANYAEKAHILFLIQQYGSALKEYERCQSMKLLTDKDLHFLKGVCLVGVKKFEEAEKELTARAKVVPEDIECLQFLFALCWRQERYQQAIGICDQIIKVNPTLEYAFACKGMCLYALERWQEVITTLRKVDEDEGSSDKYFLLGMSYHRLNKLDDAQRELDQMLRRGTDNQTRKIQALFALGEINRKKGHYAKAQDFFGQAFKTDPGQAINYLPGVKSQIRCFVESGDLKAGQAVYTEAAAIHPPQKLEEERILLEIKSRKR